MNKPEKKFTNALADETSPYLLQHAHNPVNWNPWNEEVLKRAQREDRLLLISIGYSACHWCHVMEHECFEDEETAAIMNKYFVNIKVDREERPDVDQVYMHAVQLITGRGGWPLNCIALPDGRPIFGGTYFPKVQWQQIIQQVAEFYRKDKNKCLEYASEITHAVNRPDRIIPSKTVNELARFHADQMYDNWKINFDRKEGGPNRTPKFPLPNNFEFLLRYYYHTENKDCLYYVLLSLDKMAFGGIYDQLGGGFARYSTDVFWKVPHFEKMLYDNAQLVSLYTLAWQVTKKDLYREVVYETLSFVQREMTHANGAFYSALDADSDEEEGKFYVWKKEEIDALSPDQAVLFKDYFNINEKGLWEHGNYILLRKETDDFFAEKYGLSLQQLKQAIRECKRILLAQREKRVRPGLDDKILVSWNAMMLKAYVDAYKAFGDSSFLESALKNADFLLHDCTQPDGGLFHTFKNGHLRINGYLEDYCFAIEALLALYEATAEERYLISARQFADFCIANFLNTETGLFYFTSLQDAPLIARKTETEDNVIPSSNSSMAKALFLLGLYFPESGYREKSLQMLASVTDNLIRYGSSYSNWGLLLLNVVYPFYEIALAGANGISMANEINAHYIPNKFIATAVASSTIPVLQNRFIKNKTLIYICENQSCLLPVENVMDCISKLHTH